MLMNMGWKKIVIFALIAIHTVWIANHLRLVYLDRINPWKLGGYGMYTTPNIRAQIALFDLSEPTNPKRINPKTVKFKGMIDAERLTNIGRVFRCAHVPDHALKALFRDNLELINKNIIIEYVDNKFEKKAPWGSIRLQGQIEISWLNNSTFSYKSQFCTDNMKTDIVSLP